MIALALLGGVVIGKGWERTGHAGETYEELKTFSEVLNQVQKHYVDETSGIMEIRYSKRWRSDTLCVRSRPIPWTCMVATMFAS